MLRFASLGSGSKGNAALVESGKTRILIDCGFTLNEVEKRLWRLGCDPEHLTAIVVTHEHGDHANGVGRLSRRYHIPVWGVSELLIVCAIMSLRGSSPLIFINLLVFRI